MFRKNRCGGMATNANDSVATTTSNPIAKNQFTYNLKYCDKQLKDILKTKKQIDKWFPICTFVFQTMQDLFNYHYEKTHKKGVLEEQGECEFSKYYFTRGKEKQRYIDTFGYRNNTNIENETKKALDLLTKSGHLLGHRNEWNAKIGANVNIYKLNVPMKAKKIDKSEAKGNVHSEAQKQISRAKSISVQLLADSFGYKNKSGEWTAKEIKELNEFVSERISKRNYEIETRQPQIVCDEQAVYGLKITSVLS